MDKKYWNVFFSKAFALEDWTAPDQVVARVKSIDNLYCLFLVVFCYFPDKPIMGMGLERGSLEVDSETGIQVLRGAASAKIPQCTKV